MQVLIDGEPWFGSASHSALTFDHRQVSALPDEETDLIDPTLYRDCMACWRTLDGWVCCSVDVEATIVRASITRRGVPWSVPAPPSWHRNTLLY